MPPLSVLFKKIVFSLLFGLLLGLLLNEGTFYFLRETARAPQRMEFSIPAGAADKLAKGEALEVIPQDTIFVVGDTLVVTNYDEVNHQLGALWIPAGGAASLQLETPEKYIYECSFQSQKIFGMDVREPLTIWTRLFGILYSGLPLGVLIAVYSLIIPAKAEKKNVAA